MNKVLLLSLVSVLLSSVAFANDKCPGMDSDCMHPAFGGTQSVSAVSLKCDLEIRNGVGSSQVIKTIPLAASLSEDGKEQHYLLDEESGARVIVMILNDRITKSQTVYQDLLVRKNGNSASTTMALDIKSEELKLNLDQANLVLSSENGKNISFFDVKCSTRIN